MSNHKWQHQVLPHGPIQNIVPAKLWIVEGRLARGALKRNMVVYALSGGRLLLHSPIALDETAQEELEKLGSIDTIIVPNGLHRIDAPRYKQRYPNARILCPRAAKAKVEQKVAVDGVCEDLLPEEGVLAHEASGLKPFELCYEFVTDRGPVLVVTDMLMNNPDLPGFEGWILRTIGSSGFFGMTMLARIMMLKDRAAFKAWLREMAARKPFAVLMAHGNPIVADAAEALLRAEARL